jgi:hypothetical protein
MAVTTVCTKTPSLPFCDVRTCKLDGEENALFLANKNSINGIQVRSDDDLENVDALDCGYGGPFIPFTTEFNAWSALHGLRCKRGK